MTDFKSENIRGSIASNLRKSVVLKSYEFTDETSSVNSDKNCAVCQTEFGLVLGKKNVCKFCNRGVCAKCSPEQLLHPSTRKEERVCSACLAKMMETHLAQNFNKQIRELEDEKNQRTEELNIMVQEKQLDMTHNEYLEGRIKSETELYSVKFSNLKDHLASLQERHDELRFDHKKLKDLDKKKFGDDKKKNELQAELESQKKELKAISDFNKKTLPGLRETLGELQEKEIILKSKIREKKENAISLGLSEKEQKISNELDELSHKNYILEGENNYIKQELETYKKENEDLDDRILTEEIQAKNRINDSLISTTNSKYSQEEEIRIQELKEKSKENQKIIQSLRVSLEGNNVLLNRAKIDTEYSTDPGSRPCARCLIY